MRNARRAQSAVEYIILLAGALLIVVLAIAVFQQMQGRSAKQIEAGVQKHAQLVCAPLYDTSPQTTVIAWKMHEGQGDTVADSSYNKNPGRITGAADWLEQEKCRHVHCVRFKGTEDNYVESSAEARLGSGGVTAEAWYTPPLLQPGQHLQTIVYRETPFLRLAIDFTVPGGPVMTPFSGTTSFQVRTANGVVSISVPGLEYELRPYHLAATYDAASKMISLYRDGQLIDSQPTEEQPLDTGPGKIYTGMPGGPHLKGWASDAAVYTRALSPEEIEREVECYPV